MGIIKNSRDRKLKRGISTFAFSSSIHCRILFKCSLFGPNSSPKLYEKKFLGTRLLSMAQEYDKALEASVSREDERVEESYPGKMLLNMFSGFGSTNDEGSMMSVGRVERLLMNSQ